jgi:hypothetical protein
LQCTSETFDLTVRLEQLMLEREPCGEAVAQRVLAELEHASGYNVDTVTVRIGDGHSERALVVDGDADDGDADASLAARARCVGPSAGPTSTTAARCD